MIFIVSLKPAAICRIFQFGLKSSSNMIEMHEAAMQSQLDYLDRWSWRTWSQIDVTKKCLEAYMECADRDTNTLGAEVQNLRDEVSELKSKMMEMMEKMEQETKKGRKPKEPNNKANKGTKGAGAGKGKGGGKIRASKDNDNGVKKKTKADHKEGDHQKKPSTRKVP